METLFSYEKTGSTIKVVEPERYNSRSGSNLLLVENNFEVTKEPKFEREGCFYVAI